MRSFPTRLLAAACCREFGCVVLLALASVATVGCTTAPKLDGAGDFIDDDLIAQNKIALLVAPALQVKPPRVAAVGERIAAVAAVLTP